ncbi:MAG: molybdopterin molybdotransferase MoeA [Chloroflexaceae bacterium]|nr:molybdopterin molybdotransferase MoeA [Chloroflexaceae bacterium]
MIELSVEAALARLLAGCAVLDAIEIVSEAAAGYVLLQDVYAPHALPMFKSAAVDGFAVVANDLAQASPDHPVVLPIAGVVTAGGPITPIIVPGSTIRVMNGAVLPGGASAVLPREDVQERPNTCVAFMQPVVEGQHIRDVGEDVPDQALVIPAGKLLRPAEVGLLCALGIPYVQVVRRPRVALLPTGDALLAPGRSLTPGKVRDANTPALAAFVADQGAQPLRYSIVRDHQSELYQRIETAISDGADLVLISTGMGSVSVETILAGLMQRYQGETWQLHIRPGRMLWSGRIGQVTLLGLPGDPLDALILAELFVAPLIQKLRGMPYEEHRLVAVTLQEPQISAPQRQYVRAHVQREGQGYIASTKGIGTGSGSLRSLVQANALLIIPEGDSVWPVGSVVDALLF